MKKETFLSTIPFAGFYGGLHDYEADRKIESALEYAELRPSDSLYQELQDLAYSGAADFPAAFEDMAQAYAESFLDWLSLDGKFESMTSPREYNFETDRVFVELTRSDLARLWRGVDKARFAARCKERFTSCSGFISHYSPDWRTWGPLSTWDHNQLGTLTGAYAETEQGGDWSFYNECDLLESYSCNEGMHNALWSGDKADRFWRIVNYLRDRSERPIKTLAQWHAARRAENRPWSETPLGSVA